MNIVQINTMSRLKRIIKRIFLFYIVSGFNNNIYKEGYAALVG